MKPRITAENFVRALAGQGYFMIGGNPLAEVEHGGLDIRHAWQVSGVHRLKQIVVQIGVGTFKILVVCVAVGNHLIYPRSVLRGLECVCLEVFVVVLEVKGVCIELLSLLSKLAAAYRCDKTAVHTARQEGTDRHIGKHLHFDGVCDQIAGFLDCLLPVLLVWMALKLPVACRGVIRAVIFQIMSRQQLIYIFENTLSVSLCRAKTENLTESVAVCLRLKFRIAQDSFQL